MPMNGSPSPRQGAWPKQRFACIVGAPRCGTTTLARLLENHPSVAFSNVKEPHFFSRVDLNDLDDDGLREVVSGHYLGRYFPDIDPRAQVMAEASVSYLYAPERLLPLLRLWPDAKFIIAARDPLELIPSLHQRLLYQGDETVADVEEAWRLIPERRQGRKVPRTCLDSRQLLFDEAASLGKHVSRFFEVVGRDRWPFQQPLKPADAESVARTMLALLRQRRRREIEEAKQPVVDSLLARFEVVE